MAPWLPSGRIRAHEHERGGFSAGASGRINQRWVNIERERERERERETETETERDRQTDLPLILILSVLYRFFTLENWQNTDFLP